MEYLNILLLIIGVVGFFYLYIKSIQPAKLEKKIGELAYKRCKSYRYLSSFFMALMLVSFILYKFYPLDIFGNDKFLWGIKINIILATIISIPSGYILYRGIKDAGTETMSPNKNHKMYKGIYEKIRHPQAIGEYFFWIVIALIINSIFVFVISLIILAPWIYMCFKEEEDLVIRYGNPYKDYLNNVGMFIPKK